MKEYNIKDFCNIKEDGFDTKSILVSIKNKNELFSILENSIKNSSLYDNTKSYEENEKDITLNWVNYGFPDYLGIKWVTPEFKGINRAVFMKSEDPLPVPRITFNYIKNKKDLSHAVVVNHIQEFCRENTIYDIKNNSLYRQFNNIIDFGVIIIFCF